MTESSGPPIIPARDARLTPEAVAERGFTQVKRGYAESEVRAFLRMVSDDLGSMRSRERELLARVQELEDRLARPAQPPSDQDLIAALGAETARVLGQAREAAVDLRTKADEHARRVVREAQESARELRATTQQSVAAKTQEAEDAARARAREIVAEARTLRERVLADLNERRMDLERQIGELRSSRGRLVEVYQVVERALVQATRTMAEEPSAPVTTAPDATEAAPGADASRAEENAGEASPDAASGDAGSSDAGSSDAGSSDAGSSDAGSSDAGSSDAGSGEDGRDVGALFQKLRSEASAPDDTAAVEVEVVTETVAVVEVDADAAPDDDSALFPEPDGVVVAEPVEEVLDEERGELAARDEALAPISEDLAHRAKRALQDEQNDVLDALRRQRGKIVVGKVLLSPEDQLGRWAKVLQPSVEAAYAQGAASMPARSGGAPTAPPELVTELATAVVTPLRTRLESSLESIDAKTPADVEIGIAQRLGARYREWRGQDLEDALGDALAAAFARGAYDAAPEGSRLRWVAARVGKCPDCDDNALEPTVRGDDFPTGQAHPPAHPGCRCLVVLAT